MLSRKLKDLGIRNFEELHRFGVQKESDLAQDKKFFSSRSSAEEMGPDPVVPVDQAITFKSMLSNHPLEDSPI